MSAVAAVTDTVWLSPEQVADPVPGVTVKALRDMRSGGTGPAYYKPTGDRGKITLYAAHEVDAWVRRGRTKSKEQS